jgi:hypothetical protein
MHEQRREEARELMKWIREKNDEIEPGRMVRTSPTLSISIII